MSRRKGRMKTGSSGMAVACPACQEQQRITNAVDLGFFTAQWRCRLCGRWHSVAAAAAESLVRHEAVKEAVAMAKREPSSETASAASRLASAGDRSRRDSWEGAMSATAVPVPTVEELKEYLIEGNPLGWEWRPDTVGAINNDPTRNHWSFVVQACDHREVAFPVVLRFINPQGKAPKERWLTLSQEHNLLRYLQNWTDIAPRVYGIDRHGFRLPVLFQELVPGISLGALERAGKLEVRHVESVANRIATLAIQTVPRWKFPVLWWDTDRGYRRHFVKWRIRIREINTAGRSRQRGDLVTVAGLLKESVSDAIRVLKKCNAEVRQLDPALIIRSAHKGNILWDEQWSQCRLVDVEAVSWGDPLYTLVRFLVSLKRGEGFEIPPKFVEAAQETFLRVHFRPIPHFEQLFLARLVERELSDAVWVAREHAQHGGDELVDVATNVATRLAHLREILQRFPVAKG